jgi:hypothetical protein
MLRYLGYHDVGKIPLLGFLSPDGVMPWSVAYPPSQWAAVDMAPDVFECLMDSIKLDGVVTWSSVISDTLELLRKHDTDLQASGKYEEFLKNSRGHRSGPSWKLRRIKRAAIQIDAPDAIWTLQYRVQY